MVCFFRGRRPGLAPAGEVLVLCFAKEKYPKERRPTVCDPFALLRGKPAAGRLRGAPWNSLRAGALRSDNHGESVDEACALRRACSPRNRPAAGAARRGWGKNIPTSTRAIAALGPVCAARSACARAVWAERSDGPYGCPVFGFPSGCAEERRFWRIRARVCLSDAKRREFSETPAKLSTAGCPQRSEGTQPVGSLFLGLLSFGEAKESESPAGAKPGLHPRQRHTTSYKNNSY